MVDSEGSKGASVGGTVVGADCVGPVVILGAISSQGGCKEGGVGSVLIGIGGLTCGAEPYGFGRELIGVSWSEYGAGISKGGAIVSSTLGFWLKGLC